MPSRCVPIPMSSIFISISSEASPQPSAALISPMTRRFVAALEEFVGRHGVPLVQFEKGQANLVN